MPKLRRMADQSGPSAPARQLGAAIPALAALMAACVVCGFHFVRHYRPGFLTPGAMDLVQAARYLAQTGDFGTKVVRPLLTQTLTSHGDGSLPDFGHPPLYIALCAAVMKLTGHKFYGVGDQDAVLVSLGALIASLVACYALFTRCFGHRGALLSCLLFGMSGGALATALVAGPTTLAALLFTVLALALLGADQAAPLSEIGPRVAGEPDDTARLRRQLAGRGQLWAGIAGVVFGLLYLTVYSTLILIPALVVYLWQVSNRNGRPVLVFLLTALVVTSPILWKTYRATGFPLYNTRLVELVMHTPTYPGESLYRAASHPLPAAQYLAEGGVGEVLRKAGANLQGFYREVPPVLGVFLLPLFLASALTRFADGRVNRLRNLVYVCLPLHLAGLSLFQKHEETVGLTLMYAPVASVVGIGFLLSVIRARNLPRFYRTAGMTVWLGFACVPGVLQLAASAPDARVSEVYYHLNTDSREMQILRSQRRSFMASDAPWELAFRCDFPAVWLPQDGGVMNTLKGRTGRPIDGIVMSHGVQNYTETDVAAWQLLYNRLIAVSQMIGGVNAPTQEAIRKQIRIYYPQELAGAIAGYLPVPRLDREGLEYSLILWNPKLGGTVSGGSKK